MLDQKFFRNNFGTDRSHILFPHLWSFSFRQLDPYTVSLQDRKLRTRTVRDIVGLVGRHLLPSNPAKSHKAIQILLANVAPVVSPAGSTAHRFLVEDVGKEKKSKDGARLEAKEEATIDRCHLSRVCGECGWATTSYG